MNIFKKIFSKRKKETEEKPQEECWYNNAHELSKSKWVVPEADEGALAGENSYLYATAQQAAKHQG